MNEIQFACPQCGRHLAVDATCAGTTAVCPECNQVISVPHIARIVKHRRWTLTAKVLWIIALLIAAILVWKIHEFSSGHGNSMAVSPQAGSQTAGASSEAVSAVPDDLKRGLVLYFSFDTAPVAGKILDLSGHGNNGQAVNVRWVADGHRGGSIEFGLSNSYIRVPDNDTLNQANVTLAAWVKTSFTDGQWRRIFDKAWSKEFDLTMGGDNSVGGPNDGRTWRGQVSWEVAHQWIPSGVQVANGQWHQVTATFDGAELLLYVDGRQVGGRRRAKGQPGHAPYDLTIGANESEPADEVGKSFDGMMDDVMMFDRALSPEEVQALYNSQKNPADAAAQ